VTYLGNAEIGKDKAAEAGGTPDEEHLNLKTCRARFGVHKVGGGVTDTKVP
jgi:hypothetical protein